MPSMTVGPMSIIYHRAHYKNTFWKLSGIIMKFAPIWFHMTRNWVVRFNENWFIICHRSRISSTVKKIKVSAQPNMTFLHISSAILTARYMMYKIFFLLLQLLFSIVWVGCGDCLKIANAFQKFICVMFVLSWFIYLFAEEYGTIHRCSLVARILRNHG